MSGHRGYSRARLAITLVVIGGFILADHLASRTFRSNMGEGGLQGRALAQRRPRGVPGPAYRQARRRGR